MASTEKSLRLMVEHWLAPDPASRVRVIEFRKRRSTQSCYVCVETIKGRDPVAMYFYRHGDGLWRVFPPERDRPAMRMAQVSMNF